MDAIVLEGVSYRQGRFALSNIDLRIRSGSYAALLGPTGCGKTTLLELIAGLRNHDAGSISLRGLAASRLTPAERSLGYVPQDAAVFGHLTVRANLGFGFAIRKQSNPVRIAELAGALDLSSILDRRAAELSGGEAQRVALGRALVTAPDIVLMDEPFSALDDAAKAKAIALVRSHREKATFLHVTHHRDDVVDLADRIFEFRNGRVEELA